MKYVQYYIRYSVAIPNLVWYCCFLKRRQNHGKQQKTGNITVEEWCRRWLQEECPKRCAALCAAYRVKINVDIIPAIGMIPMVELTAQDIRDTLEDLYRTGAPVSYLKKVRQTVYVCMGDACRQGNPS